MIKAESIALELMAGDVLQVASEAAALLRQQEAVIKQMQEALELSAVTVDSFSVQAKTQAAIAAAKEVL